MTTMMPSYSYIILVFVVLFLYNISLSKAPKGFGVKIIRRDLEKSPHVSEIHYQVVKLAKVL